MRVLITGCKGQLGFEIVRMICDMASVLGEVPECYRNAVVDGIDIDELDITNTHDVEAYLGAFKPDLVINPAAFTNVDACEIQKEAAFRVNVDGARNLAVASAALGAIMAQVSTDYVFAGDGNEPYRESDPPAPTTYYGVTKLEGERAVQAANPHSIIVRTAWLYGINGNNFVKTIRKAAIEKGQLKVVNDQQGNPTHVEEVAYHILLLAAQRRFGIFHVTCRGICTWYDFACEILRLSNISCEVLPCTTAEFPRPAPRPSWSALGHFGLEETVGDHTRCWKDALASYINELDS